MKIKKKIYSHCFKAAHIVCQYCMKNKVKVYNLNT